jgi:hypothetical protein
MASEPIGRSFSAQLLCDAIRNKKRVSFIYHEKERIGEPQCCGISTADHEAVRMYLIKGGSRPEQLFNVSQIKSLEILQEHFSKPGPNYKKNDSAMKEVYCQL